MNRTCAVTSALVFASSVAIAQEPSETSPFAGLPAPDHARFLDLDRNHNGVLTRDEIDNDIVASSFFAQADSDGDGRLTEQEYLAIARSTAFGPTTPNGATSEPMPQGEASGRGGAGSEDNLLGPPNIEAGTEAGPGTGPTGGSGETGGATGQADTTVILVPVQPADGVDEFARLDQNQDGEISRDEARENSIANQFGDLDKDGDGQINRQEYQAYAGSINGSSVGSPPAGGEVPAQPHP